MIIKKIEMFFVNCLLVLIAPFLVWPVFLFEVLRDRKERELFLKERIY